MKARTTGTYALIAFAAVATVVVCLSRRVAVETVYPAERAWRALTRGAWRRVQGAWHGAATAAENERLRRRVEELSLAEWQIRRLEEENARLRRTLEYRSSVLGKWIPAEILSDGGALAARHALRVDRGSLAGVKKGAVVIVPEGLVGRVESVTPHTAEIRLVTDPSLKVGCEVELPGGATFLGVLSGGMDDCLLLRHILTSADMPPGASCPVYTSGLGGVYPRGIQVGTLERMRKDPDAPRREGEVRPSVNFATLKDVFVNCEK